MHETEQIYILVFVDDLIIAGKNINELQEVKVLVGKHFIYIDISELSHFLGMRIVRNRSNKTLSIFQDDYARKIVTKYSFKYTTKAFFPIYKSSAKLTPYDGEVSYNYRERY